MFTAVANEDEEDIKDKEEEVEMEYKCLLMAEFVKLSELDNRGCMGHNIGWEAAASALSHACIGMNTCNAVLLDAADKS
nr:hypothetical protein [Tanacetum cinerariifolium]